MREQPISAGLPGFSTTSLPATATDTTDVEEAELVKLVRSFATTNIVALFPFSRNAQKSATAAETSIS